MTQANASIECSPAIVLTDSPINQPDCAQIVQSRKHDHSCSRAHVSIAVLTTLASTVLSLGMLIVSGGSSAQPLNLTTTLQQQIISKNLDQRSAAFKQLTQIGSAQIPESLSAIYILIAALNHTDATVRKEAAIALRDIGAGAEAAIPELENALQDSDPEVRRCAVSALQSIDAKPVMSSLLKALNDSNSGVRSAAVEALGGTSYQEAIPTLSKLITHDPSSDVRNIATISLAKINENLRKEGTIQPAQLESNDAITVQFIRQALKDPSLLVRRSALQAIDVSAKGGVDLQATVPELQTTLKDRNSTIRSRTATALGSLGQSAVPAIPDLKQALKDEIWYVRGHSATALGKILPKVDSFKETDHAALQQLIHLLEDPDVTVRTNALTALKAIAEYLEGKVESKQFDLDQAIAYVSQAQQQISNPALKYDAADIAAVNRRLNLLRQQKAKWEIIGVVKDPKVLISLSYVFWLLGLFWLRPLWLLQFEQILSPLTLKLPILGTEISLQCLLLRLQYHHRVLDAWVALNLETVREQFQKLDTVKNRAVYIPIPVTLDGGEPLSHLNDPALRDRFKKHLLILGEGGSGKTSLACQIAIRSMSEQTAERLCLHPMIPVLLEEEIDFGDKDPFDELRKYILGKLEDMSNIEDFSEQFRQQFLEQLLKKKRILLIVDHLSEMSAAMQKMINPNDPRFPANALIVTARTEGSLNRLIAKTTLEPSRIKADYLFKFMSDYLTERSQRDLFTNTEIHAACTRLSAMVGEREMTVLLARMYADQLVQTKLEATPDISEQMPDTIPELMLQYLNELNRHGSNQDQHIPDQLVHQAAKLIAWECLRETYRPMAAKRTVVEQTLGEALGEQAKARLTYLEERLRLIKSKRSGAKDEIIFVLDPLAEYLAGLQLVELYKQNQSQWQDFLTKVESRADSPKTIAGFLMAVRDCCIQSSEVKVPDFVVPRLDAILDSLSSSVEVPDPVKYLESRTEPVPSGQI